MGKKRTAATISVDVEIDLDDIVDQIPDEEILKCAREIGDGSDGKAAAIRAITEIRSGRLDDAVTTLEREFLPRWADRAECESAYNSARAA
jgi:hypothetical protein